MRMDHSLHTAHHEAGQVKVVFNGFNEKIPSTQAPPQNNRRTDKPTALPWGFTLSRFKSKVRGLGSKFQGVTGDMAC